MENEQENEDRFTEFLKDLNDEYEGDKFRMLRFLLYDYLPLSLLNRKDITVFDLFDKLRESGDIKYTEINLLSEIAEVTNLKSAKQVINKYTNDAQRGNGLSPYRKAFHKALMAVTIDDLLRLRDFYKLSHKDFDNIWDLVFHLEKQGRLDSTEVKIRRFASNLNSSAKQRLANLSSLVETKEHSQSTSSTRKDLSPTKFNVMLLKTSQWYQNRDKTTMLKLLFKDKIESEEHNDVISLFDALKKTGDLKRTNYKILIDMVKVTDTHGVVNDVKSLSDANKDDTIKSFTDHRQQLMELGKALSRDEANLLGGLYNVSKKAYTDEWSLIMHLEKTKDVFVDGEFIQDLIDIGLHHVASKLITTNKRSCSPDVPKSKKRGKRKR